MQSRTDGATGGLRPPLARALLWLGLRTKPLARPQVSEKGETCGRPWWHGPETVPQPEFSTACRNWGFTSPARPSEGEPMKLTLTAIAGLLLAAGAARAAGPAVVVARDAIQPQVTIDPKGNVFVVFLQRGNIAVCASTDKGKTFGAPVVAIDAKGKARGGRQRGPRIGSDAKGHLVVTAPITFDAEEAAKKYPVTDL